MKIAIAFSCLMVFGGCNKQAEERFYHATILNVRDLACNRPLAQFAKEDSLAIAVLAQRAAPVYNLSNLPLSLTRNGQEVLLKIRPLKPEEMYVCNTGGVVYPGLMVVEAPEK